MNSNIDQEWDTFSESSEDRMGESPSPERRDDRGSRSSSPYQAKGGRSNYGGGGGYRGYGRSRPAVSHSKFDIMRDIDSSESASGGFWLNLFSLDSNVSEEEILRYYESIPAINAYWHRTGRPTMDVEFETRDDLVRAVDMGTCEFNGVKFCIRASKRIVY